MSETKLVKSKYVDVKFSRKEGKTTVWSVVSLKDGSEISTIEWCQRWRQYVHTPRTGTEYTWKCMDAISGFVRKLSYAHYHMIAVAERVWKDLKEETKNHITDSKAGFYAITLNDDIRNVYIVCCCCGKCLEIIDFPEVNECLRKQSSS